MFNSVYFDLDVEGESLRVVHKGRQQGGEGFGHMWTLVDSGEQRTLWS